MENNKYCVHYFKFGLYLKTYSNLTFDEAYKIAVPEESTSSYPGNKWHVMMKSAVITHFEKNNGKLLVSFEEDYDNSVKNKNENLKYRQEYHIEKQ